MLQCYVKKNCLPEHYTEDAPRLLYISKLNEEDYCYPRIMHAHQDFVEISLIRSGAGRFIIGGKKYQVKAGDIIILNSGVIHDESLDGENRISSYTCAVSGIVKEGIRKNALINDDEVPVIPSGELFSVLDGIFSQIFHLLCNEYHGGEETSQYLVLALVNQLNHILDKSMEPIADAELEENVLAKRIKEYIDNYYMEDISLKVISDNLNISVYYLSHVFKEIWGYSPMQYILRRRIGEAQSLLIGTDYTVTKIGDMVGYGNPSHFNSIFTKNVGMSPRNYRKHYQCREAEKQNGSVTNFDK